MNPSMNWMKVEFFYESVEIQKPSTEYYACSTWFVLHID